MSEVSAWSTVWHGAWHAGRYLLGKDQPIYLRPQLSAEDEAIIAAIESPESPDEHFDKQAFEAAIDRLAPQLTQHASRLAVIGLLSPVESPDLTLEEDEAFFALHFPVDTHVNWIRHVVARVLYAMGQFLIGWRVGAITDVLKRAIEQKASEGEPMVRLLEKVTESLKEYVTKYNEDILKGNRASRNGDQELRNLCRKAEDRAISLAVPWGLKTLSQWYARRNNLLYSNITALRSKSAQVGPNGVVRKIQRILVPVLKQAYKGLGKPLPKTDLSVRKAVLQFPSEPEKQLPSDIQELLPALIKLLRNEHLKKDNKEAELRKAIEKYQTENGWIDQLLALDEFLKVETNRNYVTELLFGQLTSVDLYHYLTLIVQNVEFALTPDAKAKKGEEPKHPEHIQLKTLMRVLSDTIFDRYVMHWGGMIKFPEVSMVIDAGAENCMRLATEAKKGIADAMAVTPKEIEAFLNTIPTHRTTPGIHLEWGDVLLDDNAAFDYLDATRFIHKLPQTVREEGTLLGELCERIQRAVSLVTTETDLDAARAHKDFDQFRCDDEERLLLRFNEVRIGELAKQCREELDSGRNTAFVAMTTERCHQLQTLLGRATHAVEFLRKSNITAFEKTLMTQKSQKIFEENLARIGVAHRDLQRKLHEMERIQKLYDTELKRQKESEKWIEWVTGKNPNWYVVNNTIESIDRRIEEAKKTFETDTPQIAELLYLRQARHLLATARHRAPEAAQNEVLQKQQAVKPVALQQKIIDFVLTDDETQWLREVAREARAPRKEEETMLPKIERRLQEFITGAIKDDFDPLSVAKWPKIDLVTRVQQLKARVEHSLQSPQTLSQPLLDAVHFAYPSPDKEEEIIKALRESHTTRMSQLIAETSTALEGMQPTIRQAEWHGNGITFDNMLYLKNVGKGAKLVWQIKKVKKVYCDDLLSGFARFIETPSHQEEMVRVALKIAKGMLKQING